MKVSPCHEKHHILISGDQAAIKARGAAPAIKGQLTTLHGAEKTCPCQPPKELLRHKSAVPHHIWLPCLRTFFLHQPFIPFHPLAATDHNDKHSCQKKRKRKRSCHLFTLGKRGGSALCSFSPGEPEALSIVSEIKVPSL